VSDDVPVPPVVEPDVFVLVPVPVVELLPVVELSAPFTAPLVLGEVAVPVAESGLDGSPFADGASAVPVLGAPFIEGAPVFGAVVFGAPLVELPAWVCAGGGATVVSPALGFTPIVGVKTPGCDEVSVVELELFVEFWDWAKAEIGIAPAARRDAKIRGEDVVFIHPKIARPAAGTGRGCGGGGYRAIRGPSSGRFGLTIFGPIGLSAPMQIRKGNGWALGAVLAIGSSAWAGTPAVKVTAIPKTDATRQKTASAVAMQEFSGIYKVIVKNVSFMDATPALTAEYRVYFRRDDGMKQAREVKPQRLEGEASVEAIRPGGTAGFETKPVKLHRTSLNTSYYYANGKQSSTKDELVGVWVRVFADGKMIAEYMSSVNLSKLGAF